VALGLQHQRPDLVLLAALERLGRAGDSVEGQRALLAVGDVGGERGVEVDLLPRHDLLAGAADGHRLVLDDRPQPRSRRGRLDRVDAPQEDLQRALVGVLGVVGAQGVAAGEPQQGWSVVADDREHAGVAGRCGHGRPPCRCDRCAGKTARAARAGEAAGGRSAVGGEDR
jgi:hypothetical protein